jgi:hypothetical protein
MATVVSASIVSASILSAIHDEPNRPIYAEFLALLLQQYGWAPEGLKWQPLKETTVLSFAAVDAMAFQLALQLRALEARGQTLLFWHSTAIWVLEQADRPEKLYLLADLGQRVPLAKKDETQLVLVYPTVYPLPPDLCAPELLKINALPFRTHRSASYYSLALMCLRLLQLPLPELNGTKLFYFLERCLKIEPSERLCFYL